ncbi:hypothetical protein ECTPHS_09468 [Ectothiorhodospira sp. PHS-1]|uniref:hypothetical protein n=1 Tax=Ectothiorhodospira sp. PHS-1 TaxID=519989 RepID=UPI00024A8709|nr:hypothetical protein [Ectothiorhodospira sp. PHS-1]EHQ52910.1 hypothetical protein ECTPHS_09468 [Ectothiorhodospira sp. PHS-1]
MALSDLVWRLRSKPRSEWTRAEVLELLRCRETGEQVGFLSEGVLAEVVSKAREPAKRGRKEKLTPEFARQMLEHFEGVRRQIADREGVPLDRVQDKRVAEWIAFNGKDSGSLSLRKKWLMTEEIRGWVKYLKRKVKSG